MMAPTSSTLTQALELQVHGATEQIKGHIDWLCVQKLLIVGINTHMDQTFVLFVSVCQRVLGRCWPCLKHNVMTSKWSQESH